MAVMKYLNEALHFACTIDFWRMTIFWTLSLIVSYLQLFFQRCFSSQKVYSRCAPTPVTLETTAFKTTNNVTRKPVCIITGATSGLGAAAAFALSREGFYVVLAGRSTHLLSKVMADIKKHNNNAQLKAFQIDLLSFQSILQFRDSLQQWLTDSDIHSSVQLLINNAGIFATSPRVSLEGYDEMMGTNYIGAFCLTKVLLPLLENNPVPSRIINVTSFTHRTATGIKVDKEAVMGTCFSKANHYPFANIYEFSKLCLVLFSYELHQQFYQFGKSYHVSVIAVDPGAVKTNIMREVPSCLSWLAFVVLKILGLLQSPENGVCAILDAALAPPETSGTYFFGGGGQTLNSSRLSYSAKFSKDLWDISCGIFRELQLAHHEI